MRVMGIDPGLRNMGWGMIEMEGSRLRHLGNGICHGEGTEMAQRLHALHLGLTAVIAHAAVAALEGAVLSRTSAEQLAR